MTSGPLPARPPDFQAFPWSSSASIAGKASATDGPLGLDAALAAGSSSAAIPPVPLIQPAASSAGPSKKLNPVRLKRATIVPSQRRGLREAEGSLWRRDAGKAAGEHGQAD